MKSCLSPEIASHPCMPSLSSSLSKDQCGLPLVREGYAEMSPSAVTRSPVSQGAVQMPDHSQSFKRETQMDDFFRKGQTFDENCSAFYGSPNPCSLQPSVKMTPRVYSSSSQMKSSSISDSFAQWAIDSQHESPHMVTPDRGCSPAPPVPPRPSSAHPQLNLDQGGLDPLNGQLNGFFPPRHASPSPTSQMPVPPRPRSANPVAHGHVRKSTSGHGLMGVMCPSSPGLLHQQLLRQGSGTANSHVGSFLPDPSDPALAPNPGTMADHNGNACDSHVRPTDKFSGFNADRTLLAMSQLTPLLSASTDVHANGGSPRDHEFLHSSSTTVNPMTASAHTILSAPSPSRNTEHAPLPPAHRSLDMAAMHASSMPTSHINRPPVATEIFSSGMHGPRADFLHEHVPEDSISFLPPRVGSMPNTHMHSMVSNHSSSHSAVGGFAAPSAADLAASAEFTNMHKGWLDIQSRSADGIPMGGAPWPQSTRGTSAGEVAGALDMNNRVTDPVSRGSTYTDGHTELFSDSDDTQDEMEHGENKLGAKRAKDMNIKRAAQKNSKKSDAGDVFSFPGSATGGSVHDINGGSSQDQGQPVRRKRATNLTQDERRERRRRSNRESARRSRMRKLEESQQSETQVSALQDMLTLANDHLETMKNCLLQEEARCNHLRQHASSLLSAISAEASTGRITAPVATQATALQRALMMSTPTD